MAIKHNYWSNVTPEESKKRWQDFNKKRYNSPEKINAREGMDRANKMQGYDTKVRPEGNNTYFDRGIREENSEGNYPIKKKTVPKKTINELLNYRTLKR